MQMRGTLKTKQENITLSQAIKIGEVYEVYFCPNILPKSGILAGIWVKKTKKKAIRSTVHKCVKYLLRTHVCAPPCQILAQMGHPVAQNNSWQKSGSRFWQFSQGGQEKTP